MKIAFFAFKNVGREGGSLKRICSQIRCWKSAGHDVHLFCFGRDPNLWEGARDIPHTLVQSGGLGQRFRTIGGIVDSIRAYNPDLIFFRWGTHYPGMKKLFCQYPTVIEINSDDMTEYTQQYSSPAFFYHRLTRKSLLRRAAGVNYVTQELKDRFTWLEAPGLVISNGINFQDYQTLPARDLSPIRLVFIGSPNAKWHGEEGLVDIARANPDWIIDVIGLSDDELRTLVGLPANIHAHGYLAQQEYISLMAHATVAVGTLGLYKKSMNEACPLKVREYLAYGLPIVIGYRDSDLLDPFDFVLEVPNRRDGVRESLDQIRSFVRRWRGRRVPRERVQHLDLEAKERVRLNFFQEVIKKSSFSTRPRHS